MAFTRVVGPGIHSLSNIDSHNIHSSGIITATKFDGPFDSINVSGAVASAAGYIVEGQGTDTPILGVLNGIFYNAATTLKPTFANHYVQVTPANSEDIDAFVFDNPQQQYVVATDATVAQAGFLETYDMNVSAGSTTTGQSSATLDIGDTSADAASWRLLRSAEDPENEDIGAAFASVVVVANLLELQS